MKRRTRVAGTIILIVVLVAWVRYFWFSEVFRLHRDNEANRAALLRVHSAVQPGASPDDVLRAYWQHRTDDLRLHADNPTRWVIRMPLEFGASDWLLWLEFKNGKVVALRMRTSDGPAPAEAPPDKQP